MRNRSEKIIWACAATLAVAGAVTVGTAWVAGGGAEKLYNSRTNEYSTTYAKGEEWGGAYIGMTIFLSVVGCILSGAIGLCGSAATAECLEQHGMFRSRPQINDNNPPAPAAEDKQEEVIVRISSPMNP